MINSGPSGDSTNTVNVGDYVYNSANGGGHGQVKYVKGPCVTVAWSVLLAPDGIYTEEWFEYRVYDFTWSDAHLLWLLNSWKTIR